MIICPKIITNIEAYKRQLRWEHIQYNAIGSYKGMDAYQAAREEAQRFWYQYERVNRDYCPEDPVYSVTRTAYTTVASTDIITFQTPTLRKWRLLEMIIGSEATASALHRLVWQVSTGGTTETAGNLPEKFDIDSPASMFTTAEIVFNWSVQPTLSGQSKVAWAFNELGGFIDWKAAPGAEPVHRNSEQVSYRSVGGIAVVTTTVIFEEM